jgi:hypothetical protein
LVWVKRAKKSDVEVKSPEGIYLHCENFEKNSILITVKRTSHLNAINSQRGFKSHLNAMHGEHAFRTSACAGLGELE